ncbi:hypothetical protein J2S43_003060 [Catenuloplanes nepalensis]|uniref:Uncharacterized protein n=1 Tax=Catenuloplanes nepalensis TaxID=587533 RepID=A0ABT9MT36_9ACTN|nr:hypothetical protein [Catenuloplanes nepalensis]
MVRREQAGRGLPERPAFTDRTASLREAAGAKTEPTFGGVASRLSTPRCAVPHNNQASLLGWTSGGDAITPGHERTLTPR